MATAGLFMLGKWLISYYLSHSSIGTTYGVASSMVMVLLWVYYSAIILYFGAEFTRNFTEWRGSRIYPTEYAVWVEHLEVESKSAMHATHLKVIDKTKPEDMGKIL